MAKKNKKVINNTTLNKVNVKNSICPNRKYAATIQYDISFEGLYYSISLSNNQFTNYLNNQEEFMEKFRQIRKIIVETKNKDFLKDLILAPGMRHCHLIKDEKRNIAIKSIENALEKYGESKGSVSHNIEQLLGDEEIYQIGLDKGVRLIGTYNESESIFRVYLVDYHHYLYADERFQKHNKRNLIYCPMSKEK